MPMVDLVNPTGRGEEEEEEEAFLLLQVCSERDQRRGNRPSNSPVGEGDRERLALGAATPTKGARAVGLMSRRGNYKWGKAPLTGRTYAAATTFSENAGSPAAVGYHIK